MTQVVVLLNAACLPQEVELCHQTDHHAKNDLLRDLEHFRMIWNILECAGTFHNDLEHFRMMWNILK